MHTSKVVYNYKQGKYAEVEPRKRTTSSGGHTFDYRDPPYGKPAKAYPETRDGHKVYRKWYYHKDIQHKCFVEYRTALTDGKDFLWAKLDIEKPDGDKNSAAGTIVTNNEDAQATGLVDAAATTQATKEGIIKESHTYLPDIEVFKKFDTRKIDPTSFFDIRSVLGVFGLPYQFMPIADPRIDVEDSVNEYGDDLGIGEMYAEHIVSHIPILFMSPGRPSFMGKYSDKEKKGILSMMLANGVNKNAIDLEDLVDSNGKYYTFEYSLTEYYKYVNPMCRIAAINMGVGNHTLDGTALKSLNWMNYTQSKLSGIIGDKNVLSDYLAIPFYIESPTQISDSFSNETGDSTLSSTVNQVSDMARELQFLLGNVAGALDSETLQAIAGDPDVSQNSENLAETIDKLMGGNNFLKNIKNHLISITSGGKMMFPRIWTGSDFSRSYNITIKLRSPEKDNLSLYFNIIVPTLHLIGFVAPHMLYEDPNSYGNPFLIRAMYKGFFNVDMGIIQNMDISKGDKALWNANGIPSAVDISFSIADLYNIMSITKTDSTDNWKYDTLNNTALMDYISNLCGINIYRPEVGRTMTMWFVNNFTNRAKDFLSINVWGNIKQSIATGINKMFLYGRL